MARMPDGWIVINENDGKDIWIKETRELIFCKNCKHRPELISEQDMSGFCLEFPDNKCPCQCDDGYYSWMPYDDWFCKNGERRSEE